jgi:uncharacterized protein (AIM24 family)
MATFEIEHAEGMRWVKVTLNNETVRAEKGALSYMRGDITLDTPLPTLRGVLVSMISDESPLRPRYRGTGELYLESSLGGFHVLEMRENEPWIFDNGAYWAAESEITLSITRERFTTSFFAGEGFLWFVTKAWGKGKVVLAVQGPVEEVELNNGRLVVDGKYVIARTDGISFSISRPTRSRMSYYLSGEGYARVYQGTGRLLLCTTPYWRLRLKSGEVKDSVSVR